MCIVVARQVLTQVASLNWGEFDVLADNADHNDSTASSLEVSVVQLTEFTALDHVTAIVSPTFNNPSSSPHTLPSCSQASLNRLGGSVTSSKYWLIPPLTVP